MKFSDTCFIFPLYCKTHGSMIIFSWKHPCKNAWSPWRTLLGVHINSVGKAVLYGLQHLLAPAFCKNVKLFIIFMNLLSVNIWFLKVIVVVWSLFSVITLNWLQNLNKNRSVWLADYNAYSYMILAILIVLW